MATQVHWISADPRGVQDLHRVVGGQWNGQWTRNCSRSRSVKKGLVAFFHPSCTPLPLFRCPSRTSARLGVVGCLHCRPILQYPKHWIRSELTTTGVTKHLCPFYKLKLAADVCKPSTTLPIGCNSQTEAAVPAASTGSAA